MGRLRLAVIGSGALGAACGRALSEAADLELAGVVRRASSPARLPAHWRDAAVVTHVRDLERIDAVLLCVPPAVTAGVAREILQLGLPIVECAILDGPAERAHYEAIDGAARNYRVQALVGAGWNPGILSLLHQAFQVLIPAGSTDVTRRPGVSLHHTEAVRTIEGVRDALTTEWRDADDGRMTRYVYAQLAPGVDPARVQAALDADPLFAGTRSLVFPVESVEQIEKEGHGLLLERRGTARSGAHQNLLLEARFDAPTFAARVMLDAVRRLPQLGPGAHRYCLSAGPHLALAHP